MKVPGSLRKLCRDRRWYWRLARMLLLFVILSMVGIVIFEERFIFVPSPCPDGEYGDLDRAPPRGRVGAAIEDVWLTAADGVRIHGWYCSPVRREGDELLPVPCDRVLLWTHGNAGNISHRLDRIRAYMALPTAIFIFDYRGYGRSQGRPSEKGVYRDARAAWEYLRHERGIPADRIVLYGVSLGGAVAAQLATEVEPAGLILESTFTSVPAMGRRRLPFIPSFLLRTRMDTLAKVPHLHLPKLIIHGEQDEIIPFEMGAALYAAAAEPKTFLPIPEAHHNDLFWAAEGQLLDQMQRFLDRVAPRQDTL